MFLSHRISLVHELILRLGYREQGESIELFAQASNVLDSLLDATTSARRRLRKANSRRGMHISDVVNPVNISSRNQTTGSTPPFIRDWIDRPSTPLPTEAVLDHSSSLSTMALFPGVPLVSDTSYDSHFWARVFDLEFVDRIDLNESFFPADNPGDSGDQVINSSRTSDAFPSGMMEGASVWRTNTEGGKGHSDGGQAGAGNAELGASAIWAAVSGPIGSMAAGEGWARATPY
jgi:hypothetical protein